MAIYCMCISKEREAYKLGAQVVVELIRLHTTELHLMGKVRERGRRGEGRGRGRHINTAL